MSSSRSRILANLNAKEKLSPGRKRSSEEAFSSFGIENTKRRTADSFDLPQVKSKSLFSSNSTRKAPEKKQMSIKSYYRDGLKENRPIRREQVKIFKEETEKKRKEDDTISLMCAEEAPEKYWELLAEERRKGLDIALKENKELAGEIRSKDETIRELRTEVSELKETAKHTEYLASVLEELGKDCGVQLACSDQEESDSEEEGEVFNEKDISASYPEESYGAADYKETNIAAGCSNSVSTDVRSPADALLNEETFAKADTKTSADLLSTE